MKSRSRLYPLAGSLLVLGACAVTPPGTTDTSSTPGAASPVPEQSTAPSASPSVSQVGSVAPTAAPTAAPTFASYRIVAKSGAALSVKAGDAFQMVVQRVLTNGATESLPAGAEVTWSGPPSIAALAPGSAGNIFPATSSAPTTFFMTNPGRADHKNDMKGTLWVLDAGTSGSAAVTVTATVAGTPAGQATVSVAVGAMPAGDATRGETIYATCAGCHGPTGGGSTLNANGKYNIPQFQTPQGMEFDFPARGLNAAPGNLAADAEWNAALFAIATKATVDKKGVTLRSPMANWLSITAPAPVGRKLTTQDLADLYAFLKTRTN